MPTTEESTFVDLHADTYLTLTGFGGGRYRLSVMLHSRAIAEDAPWWVRDPKFSVYLHGGPSVLAVESKADNGRPLPNRELRLPDRLAALEIPPQTQASVQLAPLAAGTMAYVEFDFLLAPDAESPQAIGFLRMVQDFGIRRLHAASMMEVGVWLHMLPGDTRLSLSPPEYLALCDDAEDGDPENEGYEADEYCGYFVQLVPGSAGSCTHDWCARTSPPGVPW